MVQHNSVHYMIVCWCVCCIVVLSTLQVCYCECCTTLHYTYCQLCVVSKEDARQMERTLSVNYPVLRQNKGVLLNMFVKTTVIRFLSVQSIYLSLLAFRIDVECCIFQPWCLFCLSTGQFTLLSIYLVSSLVVSFRQVLYNCILYNLD